MRKILFCHFEDESKNRLRWCYPPSFAKNLTLERGGGSTGLDLVVGLLYRWERCNALVGTVLALAANIYQQSMFGLVDMLCGVLCVTQLIDFDVSPEYIQAFS